MHVAVTGAGLRQTLEADPMTGAPRYSLEVVPLDPATGDRLPVPADVVAVEEAFSDPTEWMSAVEAKRAQIEGRDGRSIGILRPIFRMVDGRVGK